MKIINITSQLADEWDALVLASPEGWAFSLYSWLSNMADIWNLEEHSFGIQHKGNLIALMPLQYNRRARWLSSGGWGHGGPALSPDLGEKQRKRALTAIYQQVLDVARQQGASKITVSLSPLSSACLESRWGVNPLIMQGFRDVSTHSRIIDLSSDEERLWYSISQDSRQQVKKALKAGYRVQRVTWKEMLDTYYDIHVENYARTGVDPHPKGYFSAITNLPNDQAVLWSGYDPSGTAVAFHNDARFQTTSMYHLGCSRSAHLASGINYLLVWESILGAKNDGCRWYEVGEVFPNASSGKEQSLTVFKNKFGGEIHRVFRGEITLEQAALPESIDPDWQSMTKAELARHWKKLTMTILGRAPKRIFKNRP